MLEILNIDINANSNGDIKMILIREVVQEALITGYLTVEAENQLREILKTKRYDIEDMSAFLSLQLAAMAGRVRQESRELKNRLNSPEAKMGKCRMELSHY